MKKYRRDTGFSLIEVLISIAVLVLLMVPALSCYVSAARVNRFAKMNQRAAALGQNLMESVKALDIERLSLMFSGVESFTLIDSNLNGFADTYFMKAYTESGYGEYYSDAGTFHRVLAGEALSSVAQKGTPPQYVFSPPAGRSDYIFGIQNIMDDGFAYDVLITADASIYRDPAKYSDSCNNYRMPDLQKLNEDGITILDQTNSTDQQAFCEFKNIRTSCLIDREQTPSSALPVPYSDDDIKNAIKKTIHIAIKKDSLDHSIGINCSTEYTCSLDLNDDGTAEKASYALYAEKYQASGDTGCDAEIYLIYEPSDFSSKDTIAVIGDGAKGKLVIAKQDGASSKETVITKSNLNFADTRILTNLSNCELDAASLPVVAEHNLISKNEAADRIYKVRIAVYKAGAVASGDLSEPYAEFTSAMK